MKSLITEAMSITSNSSPFKQKVLRMTRIVRRNFRFQSHAQKMAQSEYMTRQPIQSSLLPPIHLYKVEEVEVDPKLDLVSNNRFKEKDSAQSSSQVTLEQVLATKRLTQSILVRMEQLQLAQIKVKSSYGLLISKHLLNLKHTGILIHHKQRSFQAHLRCSLKLCIFVSFPQMDSLSLLVQMMVPPKFGKLIKARKFNYLIKMNL